MATTLAGINFPPPTGGLESAMKLGSLFVGFRRFKPKRRIKSKLSVGNPALKGFVGPPAPKPAAAKPVRKKL